VRWPYLVSVALYCSGIFWLSAQPLTVAEPLKFPHYDKFAHAILFGALSTMVAVGMWRSSRRYSNRARFWAPIVFASLYGLGIEIYQAFVPFREFDPWDVVANTAGALLAQSCLALLVWRFGPVLKGRPGPAPTVSD